MNPKPTNRMPDQVHPALRHLDDRYGIVWRIANVFRRFDARWIARFGLALVTGSEHRRPVFIIGMPRSGTTFLFRLLSRSGALGALPREGHDIWRLFHHPRYSGWSSDHVGSGEVRYGERRVVNAIFTASLDAHRVLEKTADNCVRALYLRELFPDAIFVVMTRNPCDVINSYINGWLDQTGRFRSYYVPERLEIEHYPHEHRWCSTLIEGWRNWTHSSVPEIAFAQWVQYVDAIKQARAATPDGLWVECHLEHFLSDPTRTSERVYSSLGISGEPALAAALEELLANPVNSLTAPGEEKWRTQNASAIYPLLPRIASRGRTIGYNVNPVTGEYEIEDSPVAV